MYDKANASSDSFAAVSAMLRCWQLSLLTSAAQKQNVPLLAKSFPMKTLVPILICKNLPTSFAIHDNRAQPFFAP